MEIRRTRKRRHSRPRLTNLGKTVLILIAGLAVLVTFLFSRMGQWISREVFMPLFTKENADVQTEASPAQNVSNIVPAEEKIHQSLVTIPGITCYALQMGVYADYENALRNAEELRAHGAAGYIYTEGDKYRVLAAGYEAEDALASVREQLNEGGYQSATFQMEIPERSLSISGESEQIDRYSDGILFLPKLAEKLYDLSIRFDSEGIALEKGREELTLLEDETKKFQDVFSGASNADGAFDQSIQSAYEELIHEMDDILLGPAESRAAFSAGVKWLRLWLFDRLISALAI